MPRGDGTGRGLGGCTVRGVGAAGKSGASRDRGAGFLQRIMDSGSGSEGRLTGRGKGNGMTMWDMLFSWLERVSRK